MSDFSPLEAATEHSMYPKTKSGTGAVHIWLGLNHISVHISVFVDVRTFVFLFWQNTAVASKLLELKWAKLLKLPRLSGYSSLLKRVFTYAQKMFNIFNYMQQDSQGWILAAFTKLNMAEPDLEIILFKKQFIHFYLFCCRFLSILF